MISSGLPTNGLRLFVARVSDASLSESQFLSRQISLRSCVRDAQGAKQSGLPDRANAEPEGARARRVTPKFRFLNSPDDCGKGGMLLLFDFHLKFRFHLRLQVEYCGSQWFVDWNLLTHDLERDDQRVSSDSFRVCAPPLMATHGNTEVYRKGV